LYSFFCNYFYFCV
jgi:hypothetical protein